MVYPLEYFSPDVNSLNRRADPVKTHGLSLDAIGLAEHATALTANIT